MKKVALTFALALAGIVSGASVASAQVPCKITNNSGREVNVYNGTNYVGFIYEGYTLTMPDVRNAVITMTDSSGNSVGFDPPVGDGKGGWTINVPAPPAPPPGCIKPTAKTVTKAEFTKDGPRVEATTDCNPLPDGTITCASCNSDGSSCGPC